MTFGTISDESIFHKTKKKIISCVTKVSFPLVMGEVKDGRIKNPQLQYVHENHSLWEKKLNKQRVPYCRQYKSIGYSLFFSSLLLVLPIKDFGSFYEHFESVIDT